MKPGSTGRESTDFDLVLSPDGAFGYGFVGDVSGVSLALAPSHGDRYAATGKAST